MEEVLIMKKYNTKGNVVFITTTAILMAMNIALSSVSIPVPGGHLYLNDIVIVLSSVLLNPLGAFIVGGVGAFLGDFFFYPAPMFVSLATHGIQALTISLIVHNMPKKIKFPEFPIAIAAALIGGVIMVVGYTLGRAYVYATPEYALIKLPFEILQASLGIIFGLALAYPLKIKVLFQKMIPSK